MCRKHVEMIPAIWRPPPKKNKRKKEKQMNKLKKQNATAVLEKVCCLIPVQCSDGLNVMCYGFYVIVWFKTVYIITLCHICPCRVDPLNVYLCRWYSAVY